MVAGKGGKLKGFHDYETRSVWIINVFICPGTGTSCLTLAAPSLPLPPQIENFQTA